MRSLASDFQSAQVGLTPGSAPSAAWFPEAWYLLPSCGSLCSSLRTLSLLVKVRVCSSYPAESDSVTPWIVAHQAPLSTGFSRQEYWSGLPFPPRGDPPDPGTCVSCIEGRFFTTVPPGMPFQLKTEYQFLREAFLHPLDWIS